MRRFHDRLRQLVRLRKQQLRQQESELDRQRQIVSETRDRIDRLLAEMRTAADLAYASTGSIDSQTVWMALKGGRNLELQIDQAREQLRQEMAELQRRQSEYRRSSSRLEALKVLRKQQLDKHRTAEARARQREMDTLAMANWIRTRD